MKKLFSRQRSKSLTTPNSSNEKSTTTTTTGTGTNTGTNIGAKGALRHLQIAQQETNSVDNLIAPQLRNYQKIGIIDENDNFLKVPNNGDNNNINNNTNNNNNNSNDDGYDGYDEYDDYDDDINTAMLKHRISSSHQAIVAALKSIHESDTLSPSNISLLTQLETDTIPIANLIRSLSKSNAHIILLRLATLYPAIIEKEIRSTQNAYVIGQNTLVSDNVKLNTPSTLHEIDNENENENENDSSNNTNNTNNNNNNDNIDSNNDNRDSNSNTNTNTNTNSNSSSFDNNNNDEHNINNTKSSKMSNLSNMSDISQNNKNLKNSINSNKLKNNSNKQKLRNFNEEMNRIANRLGYANLGDLKQASKLYQIFGDSVNKDELTGLRYRSQSLKIDLQLEKWKSEQSNKANQKKSKLKKLFDLNSIVDESDIDSLKGAPPSAKKKL